MPLGVPPPPPVSFTRPFFPTDPQVSNTFALVFGPSILFPLEARPPPWSFSSPSTKDSIHEGAWSLLSSGYCA